MAEKKKKQVFSFRAELTDIENWKAYAQAKGLTMETIGSSAMNEYMLRHKLTDNEHSIYAGVKLRNKEA